MTRFLTQTVSHFPDNFARWTATLASTIFLSVTVAHGQTGQNNLQQLVQASKPCIFSITTFDDKGNPLAYGTGFFIDEKGTGISNCHVLAGASSARIKTLKGNHYTINNIISQNEKMDIIKFSIKDSTKKTFPFLKLCSSKPKEGEDVFVIGNPKELEYSVSNGIVASVRNVEDMGEIIQTTAPISSGNSGSPLINMKGEAIGVVSFTSKEGQNLNFAMSVSNFSFLAPINKLKFPTAKTEDVSKNENSFKRFEWGSSSANILQNEKMKLTDKDKSTLFYSAEIGDIEVQIEYRFDYDELKSIYFIPIRNHPTLFWTHLEDIKYIDAKTEFITMEKKLITSLGDSYSECITGALDDCSFSETKPEYPWDFSSKADSYFKWAEENKLEKPFCEIRHRWTSKVNNSYYELVFTYRKDPLLETPYKYMQCNWYLKVHPIK